MALLMAEKASCRRFLAPQCPQSQRRCTPFRPACKGSSQACRGSSSSRAKESDIDRRAVLFGASTVAAALALQGPALAEGEHDLPFAFTTHTPLAQLYFITAFVHH